MPREASSGEPADKPLLAVLRGERRDPPPIWLMRQAGRYLPEYRALRTDKGGFLDLVYDSAAAAEVTLQPLERFPEIDAAILFSDILIVPFALGQNLSFVAGEGPLGQQRVARHRPGRVGPRRRRLQPGDGHLGGAHRADQVGHGGADHHGTRGEVGGDVGARRVPFDANGI